MLGCTVLLLFSSREKDLLHSMTCPWFRNFNYIVATKMSSVCVCVCVWGGGGGGVACGHACLCVCIKQDSSWILTPLQLCRVMSNNYHQAPQCLFEFKHWNSIEVGTKNKSRQIKKTHYHHHHKNNKLTDCQSVLSSSWAAGNFNFLVSAASFICSSAVKARSVAPFTLMNCSGSAEMLVFRAGSCVLNRRVG